MLWMQRADFGPPPNNFLTSMSLVAGDFSLATRLSAHSHPLWRSGEKSLAKFNVQLTNQDFAVQNAKSTFITCSKYLPCAIYAIPVVTTEGFTGSQSAADFVRDSLPILTASACTVAAPTCGQRESSSYYNYYNGSYNIDPCRS